MNVPHHLINKVAGLLHRVYLGAFDKTTPLHLRDALHDNGHYGEDYDHCDEHLEKRETPRPVKFAGPAALGYSHESFHS